MMKRYLTIWTVILLATIALAQTVNARRLKIYRLPKEIVAGQLGIIVFENPNPELVKSDTKCTAEKLIAWKKSDIPILRFEQNGKQVWLSLGSYQSAGDSVFAEFMAPPTVVPGPATVFIVNGTDPSIPYSIQIIPKLTVELKSIQGSSISALGLIHVIGDGFVPEIFAARKEIMDELEGNVSLSKMPKAQQWTTLNHRIMSDWDKLPEGDYLLIEQGAHTWRTFIEQCGIEKAGMTLDFTAPPDLQPGSAKLTMVVELNGAEAGRSAPLTVTVQ